MRDVVKYSWLSYVNTHTSEWTLWMEVEPVHEEILLSFIFYCCYFVTISRAIYEIEHINCIYESHTRRRESLFCITISIMEERASGSQQCEHYYINKKFLYTARCYRNPFRIPFHYHRCQGWKVLVSEITQPLAIFFSLFKKFIFIIERRCWNLIHAKTTTITTTFCYLCRSSLNWVEEQWNLL